MLCKLPHLNNRYCSKLGVKAILKCPCKNTVCIEQCHSLMYFCKLHFKYSLQKDAKDEISNAIRNESEKDEPIPPEIQWNIQEDCDTEFFLDNLHLLCTADGLPEKEKHLKQL